MSAATTMAESGRQEFKASAIESASARVLPPPRSGWLTATRAPATCKTQAISAPMPCEAPVTSAVFPDKSMAKLIVIYSSSIP